MAETPQPVDAGQSGAPSAGQEAGAASPPPPPGYGWGRACPPLPFYEGWGGNWPPPPVGRGPLLKPGFAPGPIFIGLVAVLMGLAIVLSSGPKSDLAFLAVGVGMNLGLVWVVAFIIGAQDTRLVISRRAWARWALPPAIFFVSVALMISGVPTTARFELSRSALDQAATRAQSGTQYGSGWIGLIEVKDVRVANGTTVVDVSDTDTQTNCEFIKLGADQTAIAGWLEYANNPRDYGGGWWYGCLGWSSD